MSLTCLLILCFFLFIFFARSYAHCTFFCFSCQNEDVYLLWTVHHIAVDLWSFVVLLDDFAEIYSRLLSSDHKDAAVLAIAGHGGSRAPVVKRLKQPGYQRQYVECIPAQQAALEGANGEK